jgi:hypothetical protein
VQFSFSSALIINSRSKMGDFEKMEIQSETNYALTGKQIKYFGDQGIKDKLKNNVNMLAATFSSD